MSITKDASLIIEQLSADFLSEGKTCCRDCLRSKAMPSESVLTVTKHQEFPQSLLLEVHSMVMQSLTAMSDDRSSATLSLMNTAATAIRFAQLLLYLPSITKQRQPLVNQDSNAQAEATLSSDRLDQLIHSLLGGIVKAVSILLTDPKSMQEGSDPMSMDASTTQADVRPLACFCFLSILRLQHFCKKKQQWMIPLAKGLCDIAFASQKANASLPISLIDDAVRSMTKLLEEGTIILTNHAAADFNILSLDQHSFFAKFLSFLMARIVNLFQHLPRTGSDSNVSHTSLWKIFATLRGLPQVVVVTSNRLDLSNQRDIAFLQNYKDVASKIEKQCLKVLWNKANEDQEANHIHMDSLHTLLQIKVKPANTASTKNTTQEMLRNSRIVGRLLLLDGFLKKVASEAGCQLSIGDSDILLKLCDTYISIVLPQCFGLIAASIFAATAPSVPAFCLQSTITSMVLLLLQIESSLTLIDASKRSQFHRVLIRWMTPTESGEKERPRITYDRGVTMHPISHEFLLSLIYLYIVSSESTMSPLLTLMIKLLFDARTITELRCNISTVLIRLQTSASSYRWMPTFAAMIENEFVDHWKDFSASHSCQKTATQKRKRPDKDPNSSAFQVYSNDDVEAIGHVLTHLQTRKSPLLKAAVQTFVDEDGLKRMGTKNIAVQVKSISLLIWYMQLVRLGGHSPLFSLDNEALVLKRLLEHMISQLDGPATDKHLLANLPLYTATLYSCQHMCNNSKPEAFVPFLSVCKLISVCTSNLFLQPTQNEDTSKYKHIVDSKHRLLLGGIALLGSMAHMIPNSCPTQVLEVRIL